MHGGRDHARSWDRVAEAFEDDYHVIACDLRGHGDSGWAIGSVYGLTEHVFDLLALIEVVGEPVRMISHSFGGEITLLAAGLFPEKFDRIVSIEGAGARLEDNPRPLAPRRFRNWAMDVRSWEHQVERIYPTFEDTVARVRAANRSLTPEMAEHLARWGTRNVEGGYVWKFDQWVRSRPPSEMTREDLAAAWAEVRAPIMHLIGGRSHPAQARIGGRPLDEYFADSRTIKIPNAGHWVHHDQTAIAIAAIHDFFAAPPRSD
ncbi:MAG: alpha/beta hydrolase [Dehalococcoidia bacterium]|nr:alpha/beta hydrolase [Dehalococcoidia bacterium]